MTDLDITAIRERAETMKSRQQLLVEMRMHGVERW